RVDARQVRAFTVVAEETGEGQVSGRRRAAVLSGNDVVDLEGDLIKLLGHAAVFAAVPGTLPDQALDVGSHARSPGSESGGAAVPKADAGLGLDQRQERADPFVGRHLVALGRG